jgi:hypothetical protein
MERWNRSEAPAHGSGHLCRLLALLAVVVATIVCASAGSAKVFGVGEVDGILDLTLAYGLVARTESRDRDFVGIGNGGRALSVNADDGTLNYDTGLIANEVRLNADLTLVWRNFGAFVRGYGFYDFETDLSDREHSDLSSDADRLVGSGGRLQEYYVSARFTPWSTPVQLRVGDQIINWGEGHFLRFGTDIINPVDFASLLQPTASTRDFFVPQGMIWAASNVTETLAIEAFYQYRWEEIIDPPVGWFFSANDLIGGDGPNFAMAGGGRFSDLGTDLDEAFPEESMLSGPLGFDRTFMRIPSAGRRKPRDQGQFGVTLQALIPALNASNFGLHFINYHSRLPLVSGITADQDAIDLAVSIGATGPTEDQATLALGELSNQTRYVVDYPEDIRMLGASFNTATETTGTLIAAEVSHHFNWPVQVFREVVLAGALSPIVEGLAGEVPRLGGSQLVSGIDTTHKTQLSLNLAQALGAQLGSSRSLLSFDVGWVHFDGLSKDSLFDEDSWGYKILATLSYEGVWGGLEIAPFVNFTHDVSGVTPGPARAFIEERKTITLGVAFNYTNTITARLTYVNFFDGKPLNAGVDRDFLSFNIRYYY